MASDLVYGLLPDHLLLALVLVLMLLETLGAPERLCGEARCKRGFGVEHVPGRHRGVRCRHRGGS